MSDHRHVNERKRREGMAAVLACFPLRDQPIKNTCPVPRYSELYLIPDAIRQATDSSLNMVHIEERANKIFSDIGDLTDQTYAQYFHTVLHFEEIEMRKYVERCNQTRTSLRREDKYFVYDTRNERGTHVLSVGGYVRVIFMGEEHMARIGKLDERSVYLKLKKEFEDEYVFSAIEIEFQFNRLSFVRQHIAVDFAREELGLDLLMPKELKENTVQVHVCLNDALELVAGDETLKWYNEKLNQYQRKAVVNIMAGRARPSPYIIYGPPGTGKSSTLIEAVLQIFDNVKDSKILIATPSNSGANLICESLLRHRNFQPEQLIRLHSFNSLVRADGQIDDEIIDHSAMVDTSYPGMANEDKGDDDNIYLPTVLLSDVVKYRVVITTCTLMGALQVRDDAIVNYSHVFIDEAGQCTEPEALIPLYFLAKNGQCVLAGDPKQLGPLVFSHLAQNKSLGKSLLSRILDLPLYRKNFNNLINKTEYDERLVTGLLHHYRSLPTILNVYNDMFYDSQLIATIDSNTSREAKFLDLLCASEAFPAKKQQGVYFCHVRGKNLRIDHSTSWFNDDEAKEVFNIVFKLYQCNISPSAIGIITPYRLQVQVIQSKFDAYHLLAPKIGSVEEFQGQERHIILFSTVRSCAENVQRDARHLLGFVQCPHRLNVALSRARVLLIILGNANLLQREKNWRQILLHCGRNGTFFGDAMPAELAARLPKK